MEISSSKPQEREKNPSPATSPHSNGSSSAVIPAPTPPLTPKPIIRSNDASPYPTTFVQLADTSSFKQVVQMLTGASRSDPLPPSSAARGGSSSIPPIKSTCQKKQGFKLYERRNSLKNGLMINTLVPGGLSANSSFSPRNKPEILSPSILDFPALALSPVTPLNEDNLGKFSAAPSPLAEEDKAIAEKKFYFHPSPRTKAGATAPPELLPLFPVTSPRVSGSSS